ncbi:hypothetical protein BX265_6192 [Streptomyces sp. TLI_235]|nr:hypothetical protein [Streptomyces sp. TLI_235]PBC71582.1 hypothetical protein BX265_6192 [Streptomyces sp. TLI_235]
MGEAPIRLLIDGEDYTAEAERIDARLPRLVYEEDNGVAEMRFLGPPGFQLTLINPSDKARSLADGGIAVRDVTISSDGYSITHPTQFHKEWMAGGERRLFGCLARDERAEPRWEPEPVTPVVDVDGVLPAAAPDERK